MCREASFVLTKDRVFWSMHADSHEEIIREFELSPDGTHGVNVLRVEISPEDGDLSSDPSTWVFRLDQDITPKWHDPEKDEKRTRAALADWVAKRVIVNDHSNRRLLNGKFFVYDSKVEAHDSKVRAYDSSKVRAYDSSVIRDYTGGGVSVYGSSAVVIRYEDGRAIPTAGGQ